MRSFASTLILLLLSVCARAGAVLDIDFGGGGRTSLVAGVDLSAIATLPMPNGDVTVVYSIAHLDGVCPDRACIGMTRLDSHGATVAGGSRVKSAGMNLIRAAAIDPFGRIVVIGETPSGGIRGLDFGVVRFTADLADDFGFGGDGGVAIDFAAGQGNNDVPLALAFDADGNIVIVGVAQRIELGDSDIGVVRLSQLDGSIDPAFGKRFVAYNLDGAAADEASAVAIDSGGRVVIAGMSVDATKSELRATLTRLTAQGNFDLSFCASSCNFNPFPSIHAGRRTYFFGSLDGHSDSVSAIAIDAGDNIVIAGSTVTGENELRRSTIARFNADGQQTREHLDLQTDALSTYQGLFLDPGTGGFLASGQTGSPARAQFVQAFDPQLEFVAAFGDCGINGSAFCYTSGSDASIISDFGSFPAINLDALGRPLLATTVRNDGSTFDSVMATRLVSDRLFADNFD